MLFRLLKWKSSICVGVEWDHKEAAKYDGKHAVCTLHVCISLVLFYLSSMLTIKEFSSSAEAKVVGAPPLQLYKMF